MIGSQDVSLGARAFSGDPELLPALQYDGRGDKMSGLLALFGGLRRQRATGPRPMRSQRKMR